MLTSLKVWLGQQRVQSHPNEKHGILELQNLNNLVEWNFNPGIFGLRFVSILLKGTSGKSDLKSLVSDLKEASNSLLVWLKETVSILSVDMCAPQWKKYAHLQTLPENLFFIRRFFVVSLFLFLFLSRFADSGTKRKHKNKNRNFSANAVPQG